MFLKKTPPEVKDPLADHFICMTPDNSLPLDKLEWGLGSIWECTVCKKQYEFVRSLLPFHGCWSLSSTRRK